MLRNGQKWDILFICLKPKMLTLKGYETQFTSSSFIVLYISWIVLLIFRKLELQNAMTNVINRSNYFQFLIMNENIKLRWLVFNLSKVALIGKGNLNPKMSRYKCSSHLTHLFRLVTINTANGFLPHKSSLVHE